MQNLAFAEPRNSRVASAFFTAIMQLALCLCKDANRNVSWRGPDGTYRRPSKLGYMLPLTLLSTQHSVKEMRKPREFGHEPCRRTAFVKFEGEIVSTNHSSMRIGYGYSDWTCANAQSAQAAGQKPIEN